MTANHNTESGGKFQNIDKVAVLSTCPLFMGLSQWELKAISQLMRLVEYKRDETVYEEGVEAEAFYVVVSGRFEASHSTGAKRRVLAYLRRGDYFGEMSLLTNEPHSATIRSLSDSLILELKKDDFKRTIEHNATVSLEISRRLTARLKGIDVHSRSLLKSDLISIYSNQQRVGRTAFTINLAASLFRETGQKTILLDMSPTGSDVTSKLHMAKKVPLNQFHGIENRPADALSDFISKHPVGFEVLSVAHEEGDSIGPNIIISLLNHLAIEYRFILIDLPSHMDEMVYKTLMQSDAVYLVTDSNLSNISEVRDVISTVEKNTSFPQEKISVVIHEVFYGVRTTTIVKKELFGSRMCYSLPETPEIKEHDARSLNPFVVDEPHADYSRVIRHIARRISNTLVGLVLGSGAALGLAHIGVLKVLERERIPIDMIAGSSIGALIAALYAVGRSSAEIEAATTDIGGVWKLLRLMDVNWIPVRGLLDGKRIMKQYKQHLGNSTFDDCKIPLKIVGANLSTRQVTVLDSGLIADAVRISIAIPAIINPVKVGNDWMVDGGILSPLPIRTLEQAGANKIIAVNVLPTTRDILEKRIILEEAQEKESRLIRQKNFIKRGSYRVSKFMGRRFFPNIFDILMNTIQYMETEISEIEGEAADLLIRPVLTNSSWVDFFKPQAFIKRGEDETMKLLPKIKALVAQQNA